MLSSLERFIELVEKLQSTLGRLEKEAFLREYRDDEEVKDILHFLFNPYIVTGISEKKLSKKQTKTVETVDDLHGLLEYFKKNNTGRDADIEYLHSYAGKLGDRARTIVFGLVKKDLKLGIQDKTLNKVYGAGFIPTLDVMLAESYNDNTSYLVGKEFIIVPKLDGVRAVLINENDRWTFYSRGGRVIEGLLELESEVEELGKNFVYDGELVLANSPPGATAAEIYRATVKITSSDNVKRGINYHIFDRVLKADFLHGISEEAALLRKTKLRQEIFSLKNSKHIIEVPMIYVGNDMTVIPKILEDVTSKGEEGLMILPSNSPYECKRTKNLLKVKKFNAADVLVLEVEEGGGANKGKLGAVLVKFIGPDGKYYKCWVGSGFKQEEREYYWANKQEIIGKIIEIGYFELSKNQNDDNYSLRFPTFKYVREDKAEISMH